MLAHFHQAVLALGRRELGPRGGLVIGGVHHVAFDPRPGRIIRDVAGAQEAAQLELQTGLPVMAMGGWSGSDPALTLDELKATPLKVLLNIPPHHYLGHGPLGNTNTIDTDDMLELARVITLGALRRRESRGAHYRPDYEKRDDVNFLQHTLAYQTGTPGNSCGCTGYDEAPANPEAQARDWSIRCAASAQHPKAIPNQDASYEAC